MYTQTSEHTHTPAAPTPARAGIVEALGTWMI